MPDVKKAANQYMNVVNSVMESLMKNGVLYKTAQLAQAQKTGDKSAINKAIQDLAMTSASMTGTVTPVSTIVPDSFIRNTPGQLAAIKKMLEKMGKNVQGKSVNPVIPPKPSYINTGLNANNAMSSASDKDLYELAKRVQSGQFKDVGRETIETIQNAAITKRGGAEMDLIDYEKALNSKPINFALAREIAKKHLNDGRFLVHETLGNF